MKPINNILKFVIATIIATTICYTAAGQSINTPLNQTVYTVSNWDTAPLIAAWEALASSWITNHSSGAQRLAAATSNYNCHSYAWHGSDGGSTSNAWINYSYNGGANVSKYWTNDVYSSGNGVDEYCKLFYGTTADHSAITTNTSGVVRSKWGWWGLYLHAIADCPFQDSPVYTYYSSPISGNDLICTSNTYSATSISGASTYTWTGDKISTSGSGYSITATKTSDGAGWIHAEIYSPYSGTTFGTAKKAIWAGTPALTLTGTESGYTGNTYEYGAFPTSTHSNPNYYWCEIDPTSGNYLYYNQNYAYVSFYDADRYELMYKAQNTCGISGWYYKYIYIDAEEDFLMYPNPASEAISISVGQKSAVGEIVTNSKIGSAGVTIYSIRIIDLYGIVHYTTEKSGSSFDISIENLRDGNYIVQIDDGKKATNLSLIVKH